jgi:hypothetical protein
MPRELRASQQSELDRPRPCPDAVGKFARFAPGSGPFRWSAPAQLVNLLPEIRDLFDA